MWCVTLVPHALPCDWPQLYSSNKCCCQGGPLLCVITKICDWIGPVYSANLFPQAYNPWWLLLYKATLVCYTILNSLMSIWISQSLPHTQNDSNPLLVSGKHIHGQKYLHSPWSMWYYGDVQITRFKFRSRNSGSATMWPVTCVSELKISASKFLTFWSFALLKLETEPNF